VKSIGAYSFNGCSKLADISISASTEEIGENAFNGCEALVIKVVAGSFAETYVMSYGYNYTK
jgi:hypothetical protein